jgi:hypothetical protein
MRDFRNTHNNTNTRLLSVLFLFLSFYPLSFGKLREKSSKTKPRAEADLNQTQIKSFACGEQRGALF